MTCKLLLFTLCAGLASAQHNLPNYFQGNFQVPSAPIPQPGSSVPATGAYQPQPLYQPQAQAYQAQPQAAAQYAQAQAYAAAAARAQQQQYQPAAAAPVAAQPMNYGWSVQHAPPPPAAPQPAHPAAPAAAVAPAAAYQQYGAAAVAAPQPAQYAQYAQARARSATLAQAYQPQPQQLAPPAPVAPAHQPAAVAAQQPPPAFMRPAQVHYASVGENLAGDYKFGYRTGDGSSHREESRLPDGTVQGQYGFVDADGKERIVKYTAGVNGFQVLNDGAAAPAAAAAAPAAAPQPNWAQQGQWQPQQPAAAAPASPQWG